MSQLIIERDRLWKWFTNVGFITLLFLNCAQMKLKPEILL